MVNKTFNCRRGFPYRLAPNFMLGVIFSPEACFGGRLAVARMAAFVRRSLGEGGSIQHPVSSIYNMQNIISEYSCEFVANSLCLGVFVAITKICKTNPISKKVKCS